MISTGEEVMALPIVFLIVYVFNSSNFIPVLSVPLRIIPFENSFNSLLFVKE